MQRLADYFLSSYHSDKQAFQLEMFSFLVTAGASVALAVTAQHPQMLYLYPFYFMGSVTGCLAALRRNLIWPALLTGFFTCSNAVGFARAAGWL
jgi:hypothetical protein